jgi:hypothetical protein
MVHRISVMFLSVVSLLSSPVFAEDNDFVFSREGNQRIIMGVDAPPAAAPKSYGGDSESTEPSYGAGQPAAEAPSKREQPVAQVPAGWDSLTDGTSSDSNLPPGVLSSLMEEYPSPVGYALPPTLRQTTSRFNATPTSILSEVDAMEHSAVGLGRDGDANANAKERAMYGAFLGTLLQYVQSRPDSDDPLPITSLDSFSEPIPIPHYRRPMRGTKNIDCTNGDPVGTAAGAAQTRGARAQKMPCQ